MAVIPKLESPRANPVNAKYSDVRSAELYDQNPHPVVTLDDVGRRLSRNKLPLLIYALVGLIIGFAFSALQAPQYRATATVEVEGINDNLLNTKDLDPTASSRDYLMANYLETQIRIIKSHSVIARVLDTLQVKNRPDLWTSRGAASKAISFLKFSPEGAPPDADRLYKWASQRISAEIEGQTHLIEIGFESEDPQFAASFVNATVREYTNRLAEERRRSADETLKWLQSQQSLLKARLQESESELQAVARQNGLLFTSEKDSVAETKLREIQTALSRAQALRIEKQAKFEEIKSASVDSLSDILDDEAARTYEINLADLRRQLAEVRPILAPAHPKVRQIEAQISQMGDSLNHERQDVLGRIKNEFDEASRQEKLLSSAYVSQSEVVSNEADKAIRYDVLRHEVDSRRQLYESTLQSLQQVGMASAIRVSNVSVVDSAKPPHSPFKPSRSAYSAVGLLLGCFVGMSAALLKRQYRTVISKPGDISSNLGFRELGHVPELMRLSCGSPSGAHGRCNEKEPHEIEGGLASILMAFGSNPATKCLTIASANRQEGRTTIAVNVATALARANRRVLLVDADFRSRGLSQQFGLLERDGFSTLLSAPKSSEKEMFFQTSEPNLLVIGTGPSASLNPEVLYSASALEILGRFRSQFDAVIIDTAPLLPFPDARLLTFMADGVILVARSGFVTSTDLDGLTGQLISDGSNLIGTLINTYTIRKAARPSPARLKQDAKRDMSVQNAGEEFRPRSPALGEKTL